MGANGETDINPNGGTDGKLGLTTTGAMMICDTCCATCSSCSYCASCVSGDLPGCPTASCCTPHRIQVVVSGVTVKFNTCLTFCDLSDTGTTQLEGTDDINGTFTLVQNLGGVGVCTWRYVRTVDWEGVTYTAGGGCTTETARIAITLTYELRKIFNGDWEFQISTDHAPSGNISGVWGTFGAPFACNSDLFTTVADDVAKCKTIGTHTNGIAVTGDTQYYNSSSTNQFGYGGTATFTPCP